MSHRRPATRADRYFSALDETYARMGLPSGAIGLTSDCALDASMRFGELGVEGRHPATGSIEHVLGLRREVGTPSLPDLALWSRWRTCRHVYRFDRDLSRELLETPLPDSMPLESLLMIPYPIVYVEAPLPAVGAEARGAFAWVEDEGGEPVLSVVLLLDDGRHSQSGVLRMGAGYLGAAVEAGVSYDADFACRLCGAAPDALVGGSFRDMSRDMYVAVLNHLLYIVGDATDQRVEYRPSGGGTRRKGQAASTIHAVGEVAGRTLGSTRVSYANGVGGGTGRTVRPHVRAAHFHHYWTGPRDDPDGRKLVVHWIPPVFVGGVEEAPTTVHRSR